MRIFAVALAFVLAFTGYVGWHLWRVTPMGWPLKLFVTALFFLWMASLFFGFFVLERFPVRVAALLYGVGTTWLVAFLYLWFAFVLADVATRFHLLPPNFLRDSWTGMLSVLGVVTMVLTLGYLHYQHKYREELTIQTHKPLDKPLTIVFASDLHIGYPNNKADLSRWVTLINQEKPDLVLIGGDIIDRSLRPLREDNFAEVFHRIQAPVYTVLGNHEYYSDVTEAERFFQDAGIIVLKDSVAHFHGVDIIGRKDKSEHGRATVKSLASGLPGFRILLDHQPTHLDLSQYAGIDFQFSGHTHHGQVWPVSWITDFMYEKAWGHYQRGNTRYYISSGLGIWGPRFRIGTRSEYLVLHLSNY